MALAVSSLSGRQPLFQEHFQVAFKAKKNSLKRSNFRNEEAKNEDGSEANSIQLHD